MTTYQLLLKYRLQWFRLKTKEFIQRYYMGLAVLAIFLPGVAIGDNLNLFFKALTSPFLHVSSTTSPFYSKASSLLLLLVIYLVFARAQKLAITGGEFSQFMKSLPIEKNQSNKINVLLLLVSNHLLWVVIFASFLYVPSIEKFEMLVELYRNCFLIGWLIAFQYIFIFKPQIKFVIGLIAISLLFMLNIGYQFEIIRLLLLSLSLLLLMRKIIKNTDNHSVNLSNRIQLTPKTLKQNFYYQMLIKAEFSSTIFRLIILLFFIIGFGLASSFFANNNEGNLLPCSMVLEAILAYYVSGFFVCFDDQRQQMHKLFASLPIRSLFWPLRDYFVVVLITLMMHGLLFILTSNYIDCRTLVYLFIYHCFLLLICYPIRLYVNNYQTLLSFVVLFIITAITLFNIS